MRMRLSLTAFALPLIALSLVGVVVAQWMMSSGTAAPPVATAASERAPDPLMNATSIGTPAAATGTGSVPAVAPCPYADGLGVSRVVEIDTSGGPGFGFEHFKTHDFLRSGEVVLTFDDGPWPNNTPMVLAALASHCVKALFFPIGKHATWHPEILKKVAAGGHTIGSHTWSHRDLSKRPYEEAKLEIEKGMSAVRISLGAPIAPFFRFPALKHPQELLTYLGKRNVGVFSTDMDSFDFKTKKSEQVITNVLNKLKKLGKGIVLIHDFQQATARAMPELLRQLKSGGYKIVQVNAKGSLDTLAQYDDMIIKQLGSGTATTRSTSSVVRTISE